MLRVIGIWRFLFKNFIIQRVDLITLMNFYVGSIETKQVLYFMEVTNYQIAIFFLTFLESISKIMLIDLVDYLLS